MGQQFPLTDTVHLLVGKREKLPAQAYLKTDDVETQSQKHNFRDLENIWISINPKTGSVGTAEVAQVDDASITANPPLPEAIKQSRAYAISGQSMGGR